MPHYATQDMKIFHAALIVIATAGASCPQNIDFDGRGGISATELRSDFAVPPPSPTPFQDINEYPPLKTRTVSFNSRFYARVSGGKVWLRPNYSVTGVESPWEILETPGKAGRIKEISADGDNFIAVSESGRVFYMKFSSRKWLKWGKPLPKALYLPENRSWAISHLGPEAEGYEDPDGKFIPKPTGVSTLYLLSKDGASISYTDAWLPAEFSYHVNTPLRGRFIAESMSASASTLFVIGKSGRMFTRLADFDTMGCDPVFVYSFEPSSKPGVIRLPGEDWREQPRLAGRITSAITILQNGRGNAGRELRVEGVDSEGNGGYYSKPIYGTQWKFVKTGAPVKGPFLEGPDELGPSLDIDYPVFYSKLPKGSKLKDFSPVNNLAEITVPGLESMPLKFHTRETLLPNREGDAAKLYGTIELPDALMGSKNPAAVKFVKDMDGKKFTEVYAKVSNGRVKLRNSVLPHIAPAAQFILNNL